jgi:hypothetical protein
VNQILEWPKPTSAKQVWQFLGLICYISTFLPALAEHTLVLIPLTRKECNMSFPTWNAKHTLVEVFTLPQVFLADPRGMTRNDTESMWIHADSEQGVELNFTWVLAFPVNADPHGSARIPSENHTDTRNVLGQFRVKIYLHGLGLVLFCAVSDSDC